MLQNTSCLSALALLFGEADLESNSLEILSASIAHLNLSSFIFNIMQQKKTPHWRYEKLFAPLFSKDEKDLASLFKIFYAFTSLSILILNLSVFNISTKGFQDLSLALREMKQLSNFSLQLTEFGSFQGLRSLFASLKEIPKLASFRLIYKGEDLWDEEVELIASNLSELPKSLETLGLNFRKTQKLGKKSLLALQDGLRNLFALKSLTLVLGRENYFEKKIAFELLETLSFLKNLETIKVEFPPEVVPENFESLLKKMGGHWNLKTFTVNQKTCLRGWNQDQHDFLGIYYLLGYLGQE